MIPNFFSARFCVSTRRLPAAARSRTVVLRVRAVGQEQRSNRPKEPLKELFGDIAYLNFPNDEIAPKGAFDNIFRYLPPKDLTTPDYLVQ